MEEEGEVVVVEAKKGRLTDSVDRFLDSSPAFAASLRQVFLQFAAPAPPSPVLQPATAAAAAPLSPSPSPSPSIQAVTSPTASPVPQSPATSASAPAPLSLPPVSLLPALNTLLQELTDGVDPKLQRLSLRKFTYCDIQAMVTKNNSFKPYEHVNFKDFEWAAREAFKNMALEKSRRVGLYILGGIVVVHFLHGVARKVPYIGKHVGLLLRILTPTPIIGPLLGFVGAACWEEKILYEMLLS